jgi:hypothetical protein
MPTRPAAAPEGTLRVVGRFPSLCLVALPPQNYWGDPAGLLMPGLPSQQRVKYRYLNANLWGSKGARAIMLLPTNALSGPEKAMEPNAGRVGADWVKVNWPTAIAGWLLDFSWSSNCATIDAGGYLPIYLHT